MVLDLDTGQTDAQIGSGSHRADEGSAVAADDHCDGDVSRVDAELVANADQNGQQAVEVGVGIEQQSQRHAQDADDDGQETAQRGRDDVGHHNGHLLHDAALAQDTEEDAGAQDGGSHAQTSGSVALDDGVVQLLATVVDQNAQSAADHKDVVRGEDVQDQHDDDGQSQDDVEDEVLGTSQSLVLLAVVGVVVLAGVLSNDGIAELCDALLLLQAPEDGGADSQHQADDLHGHELEPQVVGLHLDDACGAHGGAAPGHQVHDAHCGDADEQQGLTAHVQALVDGQHGGDGDEEGGSAAAVQMADDGDEAGHQSNADDVVADLLHQRTDDLVEHACIGHDAEEQDGEDEQDSRTVDALDALLDKAGHFIQGESTGSHQNGCGDGRDADECQCRDRDIAQQQDDDRNHRCKAEQSEDSVTHGFVLPFLFSYTGDAFRFILRNHSRSLWFQYTGSNLQPKALLVTVC